LNKKAFVVVFVLLASSILSVAPAYAGKGNKKLTYEARVQLAGFNGMDLKTVPPEGPPKVRFLTLTQPMTPVSFVINIGGIDYYPNLDDVELIIMRNVDSTFRLIKSRETYSFDGAVGTLEVTAIGKTVNYGTPEAEEIVNVVGHGTGYFEGVKITAKGTDEGGVKVHTGSIMGWAGLPP